MVFNLLPHLLDARIEFMMGFLLLQGDEVVCIVGGLVGCAARVGLRERCCGGGVVWCGGGREGAKWMGGEEEEEEQKCFFYTLSIAREEERSVALDTGNL